MLFNILPPVIFVVALAILIFIVARKLPKVAREKEPEVGELEKVEATAKARAKRVKESGRKIGDILSVGARKTGKFFMGSRDQLKGMVAKRKKTKVATEEPVLESSQPEEPVTLADEPAVSEKANGEAEAPEEVKLTPEEDAKQREFKRLLEEGNIYLKSKNYDAAESSLIRAIGVNPQHIEAYLSLGQIYLHKGNYEDALNSYQEVLRLDDDNVVAYEKLGEVFFKQEKYEDSIDAYRKAMRQEPEQPQLNANLAEALRKSGQAKKAVKHYREALERQPDNDDFKLGLAKAAADSNDKELASALVAEVLKNRPENAEAQKLQESLNKLAAPSS
ncbi:tetratricopeptide repeat protein [Patescibacteria group bacterium]